MDALGLTVLFRSAGGEHDLLMVGLPGAGWHLELVGGPNLAVAPSPTAEDLLVLYLRGPVDEALVERPVAAGERWGSRWRTRTATG